MMHSNSFRPTINSIIAINLFLFIALISVIPSLAQDKEDYTAYHKSIIFAEELITEEKYGQALLIYNEVFSSYRFIFQKDYRVATQLAVHEELSGLAFDYLRKGIESGWEMKSIKKNGMLRNLRNSTEWKSIKEDYSTLRKKYESRLGADLKKKVKKMYGRDQKKAIMALFKLSSDGQDKYAENKFAPHSENQMEQLDQILDNYGYPGEKLIGNNIWMSTILSHHNSISTQYNRIDTLYNHMKPKLIVALENGEMSPFEYALIDNWYVAVSSDRTESSYGYVDRLKVDRIPHANQLRQKIGLRSIRTRNKLIDIQDKTGMNFYLEGSPWQEGKIEPYRQE